MNDANLHVDEIEKTTSKHTENFKNQMFWLILIRKNDLIKVKLFCSRFQSACQNVSGSTECSCESGYRWSDALCESNQKCCGDRKCTFSNSPPLMCVADTAGIWMCCGLLCLHRHIHYVYVSVRRADNFCSSQLLSPGPFLCQATIVIVWQKTPLNRLRTVITNC